MIADAFTQSDYAINITDPQGVLLQVNPAYLRLYKIPDESAILGQTQRIIRSPETPEAVYKDMWTTIKAGRVWRGNLTNRAFDDTRIFVNLTISPIRREERIVGYMGFALDRAQQIVLEQQLFQANKLVVLGTLGAGLAHELNNPLASILLDAEYLKETAAQLPTPEARRGALDASESVIRGADRMRRILEHLLRYSKDDTKSAPSTISLGELLQDSLLFVERQMHSRGIEIEVRAEPGLLVIGNRTQLESVLHNLLGNSRDAFASRSHPGKRILISAVQAQDGEKALIRYRDNAGGIAPEIARHIFEPFFSTKGDGGTGLGLSISKQVVEQHGGEIECESSGGETEFRILLPAARAEKASEEAHPGNHHQMA